MRERGKMRERGREKKDKERAHSYEYSDSVHTCHDPV